MIQSKALNLIDLTESILLFKLNLMYKAKDYVTRGMRFLNNNLRPGHKQLSTLMIYATDLCNSACKHCLIWAKRPVKHLPKDKIVEIMQSKCITKDTMVGLEGGEFLLHPEAMEILEWFSNNHPNFDLLSNCLKPELTINAVKKYPPKRLYVSLDGDEETYLYMRGKAGYKSVIKVLEACRDIVPISVMFTLSPYNDFDDLEHVIEVCQKLDIDVRVGVYNDISFFDTVEKAHETEIGSQINTEILNFKKVKQLQPSGVTIQNGALTLEMEDLQTPQHNVKKLDRFDAFKRRIPSSVKETSENYDFLLLYDEWRRKKTKMKCFSILDSLVVHPNGDVPICQNLGKKLGNVFEQSLDEIFNSKATQQVHKNYVNNCNQCWINFHRKYDIVMMRTMEKLLPKSMIELVFGKYQWSEDPKMTYSAFMKKHEDLASKYDDKTPFLDTETGILVLPGVGKEKRKSA